MIVLPSAEVARKIDGHLKDYHNHHPVLQVPVDNRRAEALYTCLRGKDEYKRRVSDLENTVNTAADMAAKRKFKDTLNKMKRDGRGVGLEEMLALYDMEKGSDTCR